MSKKTNRNIRKESDGSWGVNVWFGGANGLTTDHRRYYFATRREARDAGIGTTKGVLRSESGHRSAD